MSKIPRGRPAFAETQRAEILRLLREAGPRGVRREDLLYVSIAGVRQVRGFTSSNGKVMSLSIF
jgi:hypothetical protein